MSFGCYNARSAVGKTALLHDLVDERNLDVLVVTETWITSESPRSVSADLAPPGCAVLNAPRLIERGGPTQGGGLAVVFRDSIDIRALAAPHVTSFELQLVKIVAPPSSHVIIAIDRPPHSSLAVFFDELTDVIAAASIDTGDNIIVCGDLNCPGPDPQQVDDRLTAVFESFGMQQLVTEPTRNDNLLDVLASGCDKAFSRVTVDDAGCISDHRLVSAQLSLRRRPPRALPLSFRRIRDINTGEFESALRQSVLFSDPAGSVDEFVQQLIDVVGSTLDVFAPLQTFNRRPSKPISKRLSPQAVKAKRWRRKLEKVWLASGLESDRIEYRRACRAANALINRSRQEFFRQQLNDAAADSKRRWRTVRHLLHSTDTDRTLSAAECSNLCKTLSTYFLDKIANLKQTIQSKLDCIDTSLFNFAVPPHAGPVLDHIPAVTAECVYRILSNIPSKSCPLDFIPTSLIKSCPGVFSELIARLANLSFQHGCFPSVFKHAIVTPLLKKPGLDPNSPSSYRPISNLNNFSKILERIFLSHLQPHIVSSSNFNPLQSAYRKFHSTETALLNTLNQVYSAAANSQPTVLVSLDLSAAFDAIDCSTLLCRLHSDFGVSGAALNWIHSYLTGRSQCVTVGRCHSATQSVTSGVPQGSVLGPLLFTAYISPIGHLISSFGISHQQYADDTQLFISVLPTAISTCIDKLERCLSALHCWFCTNGLSLNPDKSEAIWFSTPQRARTLTPATSINTANVPVTVSDKLTTLGVILDNKLSFNSHVASITRSCNYHIRSLRHIRSCLTDDMAKSVAVALVSSRLDYANSLLYGTSQSNLLKLQRIQNNLAKLVIRNSTISSSDALRTLHWLPIKHRIDFKISTITYKLLHTHVPSYLASLLHDYRPTISLRSSSQDLLVQPSVSRTIGSRAFQVTAPTVWNGIPLNIRHAESLLSFRHQLKTHLFTVSD